jgi:RNA-directed DNA polymerase
MEQQTLYPTEAGTPQGGIISPVLANMTLDGLERTLMQHFPKVKTAGGALVNFVRYADDFLVTGRTKELLEQEVKPLIEEFLRERGLQLSAEKTSITPIEVGFDFLGQNVRKYQTGKRHKLLITPSKKNVKAFLEKIREIVKANKALPAGKLIAKLNPIIRGWANYHQHIISNKAFSSVDAMIYQAIRRWVNRRHRGKSEAWKTKKYFTTIQGDNWVFFGTAEEQTRYLIRATSVPIVRHVKIQGKPTRMTRHGKATLKNVSTFRWQRPSKGTTGCIPSGKNREDSAQSATKRSPRSLAGTAIIFFGDHEGDQTPQRTACFSIPPVTNKFIAKVHL